MQAPIGQSNSKLSLEAAACTVAVILAALGAVACLHSSNSVHVVAGGVTDGPQNVWLRDVQHLVHLRKLLQGNRSNAKGGLVSGTV